MKFWERIRKERSDITDYVIHWTKGGLEAGKWMKPLDKLIKIIECGYLLATFAKKPSIYDKTQRPTVRGPYPAVCFTEQSLEQFIKSCEILPSNYRPYGVALYKRALFEYGGRPVIYDSEEILGQMIVPGEPGYEEGKEIYKNGLPKDCQYLWFRYQPIPNEDGYVVDFTHEREWRCKVRVMTNSDLGKTPSEGVPLLLPALYDYKKKKFIHYLPKILVSTIAEQESVAELIKAKSAEWAAKCQDKYLQGYFKSLPKVKIIPINELTGNPNDYVEWVVPQAISSDTSDK